MGLFAWYWFGFYEVVSHVRFGHCGLAMSGERSERLRSGEDLGMMMMRAGGVVGMA